MLTVPKSRKGLSALAILGLASILCLWSAVPLYANGAATTEVYQGTAGEYDVVVRALGPRLVLGNAHLTVIVTDATTDRLVQNARVSVEAEGPDGGVIGPVETYREIATPQYYDVNVPADTVGAWRFTVAIDGPQGREELAFPLDVREPTVNWGGVFGILALVLLALPLAVVGLRSLKKKRRSTE